MIHTMIADDYAGEIQPHLLVEAAQSVVDLQDVDPTAEVTIVIEGDETLRDLNRQFLQIDAPTDVLSFPANEVDPDTGLKYLGDIVISYPRAVEQAQSSGEKIADELRLLVIHGFLHLIGFDHADEAGKSAMWTAQRQALNSLGITIHHLPET